MNRLLVSVLLLSFLTACGGGSPPAPSLTQPVAVQGTMALLATGLAATTDAPTPRADTAARATERPAPVPTKTPTPAEILARTPTPSWTPTASETSVQTPAPNRTTTAIETSVKTLALTWTPKPPTPASASPALVPVGQFGGTSRVVAVHGGYAYLNVGPRLIILNVDDPARPAFVGQTSPMPGVEGLAVAGPHAFVAAGEGGLRVLDVSDPAAPAEVGVFLAGAHTWRVTLDARIAYVAAEAGLHILDATDPTALVDLGFFPTAAAVLDLTVVGQVVYLAEAPAPEGGRPGDGGLRILDCSDPAYPLELGFYPMSALPAEAYDEPGAAQQAVAVTVVDGIAYLAYRTGRRGGVRIVDVADPAHPLPVGDYQDYIYYVSDVELAPRPQAGGGPVYLYAATGVNAGLLVLDVSDPARPVALPDEVPGWAQGLAVAGGWLFLADETGGLHIADVSDPARPLSSGFYDAPGDVRAVTVAGTTAYLVDGLRDLWLVDISDPERPDPRGVWTAPGSIFDLVVSGTTVYLAAETAGLLTVDISDPTQIRPIAAYDTLGLANGLALGGEHAYVVSGPQLEVIRISDPAAPAPIAVYPSPTWVRDVLLVDSVGYLVDGGLQILDLSDPARPVAAGAYPTSAGIADAVVAGEVAYLLVDGDLYLLDLSAPLAPRPLGRAGLDLPEYGGRLAVADGWAYAVNERRLRAVDVSDPAEPAAVVSYDALLSGHAVAAAEENVYVADGYGGLVVLRMGRAR